MFYCAGSVPRNRDSMASSVSTLAPPKQGFFFSRAWPAAAGGGARFLGAGRGVTAGSEPGTGRVRRRRPAAGAAGVVGLSDCVGRRIVAAGAGVVGASSSVVAGDSDIGDALDSGLFVAAGGVVGAARASSAKGRGDVSDAGTAAARTPSGVKCHSPASTTLCGLPVNTA